MITWLRNWYFALLAVVAASSSAAGTEPGVVTGYLELAEAGEQRDGLGFEGSDLRLMVQNAKQQRFLREQDRVLVTINRFASEDSRPRTVHTLINGGVAVTDAIVKSVEESGETIDRFKDRYSVKGYPTATVTVYSRRLVMRSRVFSESVNAQDREDFERLMNRALSAGDVIVIDLAGPE